MKTLAIPMKQSSNFLNRNWKVFQFICVGIFGIFFTFNSMISWINFCWYFGGKCFLIETFFDGKINANWNLLRYWEKFEGLKCKVFVQEKFEEAVNIKESVLYCDTVQCTPRRLISFRNKSFIIHCKVR